MKTIASKLGRILVSMSIISVLIFAISCQGRKLSDKKLAKIVEVVNAMTPTMVDQETCLEKVEALPDSHLKYVYTMVNIVKADIDDDVDIDQVAEEIRLSTIKSLKGGNANMAELARYNVTMTHLYNDANGEEIFNVVITPEQYK